MTVTAEVVDRIRAHGVVAMLREVAAGHLPQAIGAIRAGGLRCIEVKMDGLGVAESIRRARERFGDELLLGVGGVSKVEAVRAAVEAGARFVNCEACDAELIEAARVAGAAVIVPAASPSGFADARRAEADLVNVVGGSGASDSTVVGPDFIRLMMDEHPDLAVMASGGVKLGRLREYFGAGVAAVGVGSALLSPEWLATGDFAAVRFTAAQWLHAVEQVRR